MIMKATVSTGLMQQAREHVLRLYPTRPPVGLPRSSEKHNAPTTDNILMLTSVYKRPFLTCVARAGLLDISVPKVSRDLAGLEAKNWITPWMFSLSRRGFLKYYNITPEGLATAHLNMPDEGSGSFVHRQAQAYLRDQYINRGYRAKIEFMLNNKRADLGVRLGDKLQAVEVGISSADHEFSNITKDYAAGFDEVLVLVRESNMIRRVQELMEQHKFKAPKSLKIELLTEYLQRPIEMPIEA